jgi:hypothetical protein
MNTRLLSSCRRQSRYSFRCRPKRMNPRLRTRPRPLQYLDQSVDATRELLSSILSTWRCQRSEIPRRQNVSTMLANGQSALESAYIHATLSAPGDDLRDSGMVHVYHHPSTNTGAEQHRYPCRRRPPPVILGHTRQVRLPFFIQKPLFQLSSAVCSMKHFLPSHFFHRKTSCHMVRSFRFFALIFLRLLVENMVGAFHAPISLLLL